MSGEGFPLLHDPPGHDYDKHWFYKIPILGWVAGYSRQIKAERALEQQPLERGPVPESAWEPYHYDLYIRQRIEEIVTDNAYPKGSTFHPLDPVELIFVFRYGDLNEVEIIMDIEEAFGIKIEDEMVGRLIQDRTTFIDFIHWVQAEMDRTKASK